MPCCEFPEITLRSPGFVPPTELPDEPAIWTPKTDPVMKLPKTSSSPPEIKMALANSLTDSMIDRPSIVLPAAVRTKPLLPCASEDPGLSSMRMTALSPCASVFSYDPGWLYPSMMVGCETTGSGESIVMTSTP